MYECFEPHSSLDKVRRSSILKQYCLVGVIKLTIEKKYWVAVVSSFLCAHFEGVCSCSSTEIGKRITRSEDTEAQEKVNRSYVIPNDFKIVYLVTAILLCNCLRGNFPREIIGPSAAKANAIIKRSVYNFLL